MPLDLQRFNQRRFYLFLIDTGFGLDDLGSQLWIRTPLFGLTMSSNWSSYKYVERRVNSVWFGLILKWPTAEGRPMYKWGWEKEKIVDGSAFRGLGKVMAIGYGLFLLAGALFGILVEHGILWLVHHVSIHWR